MEKSIQDICLGIFILLLSLVIWRLTHNALGWVVLFLPGSYFILRVIYHINPLPDLENLAILRPTATSAQ